VPPPVEWDQRISILLQKRFVHTGSIALFCSETHAGSFEYASSRYSAACAGVSDMAMRAMTKNRVFFFIRVSSLF
jgi:hypothetical protein